MTIVDALYMVKHNGKRVRHRWWEKETWIEKNDITGEFMLCQNGNLSRWEAVMSADEFNADDWELVGGYTEGHMTMMGMMVKYDDEKYIYRRSAWLKDHYLTQLRSLIQDVSFFKNYEDDDYDFYCPTTDDVKACDWEVWLKEDYDKELKKLARK